MLLLPNPKKDPQAYIAKVQELKRTMTWPEISRETGINIQIFHLWKKRLGFTVQKQSTKPHKPKGGGRAKWWGDGEIKPEERADYLNDILPFAIRDEAERRGMTVDEFLAANERGEV